MGTYTATFTFGGMTYPTLCADNFRQFQLSAATMLQLMLMQETFIEPEHYKHNIHRAAAAIRHNICHPLPTAYWTFPINGQNTDWYTIASNWLDASSDSSAQLGSTAESGYSTFPELRHST